MNLGQILVEKMRRYEAMRQNAAREREALRFIARDQGGPVASGGVSQLALRVQANAEDDDDADSP